MSSRRYKIPYKSNHGGGGMPSDHFLYVYENYSSDTVTLYDEDGDIILIYNDTMVNGIHEAIVSAITNRILNAEKESWDGKFETNGESE